MTFYTQIDSPVGTLILVGSEAGLSHLLFGEGRHHAKPDLSWKEDKEPLGEVVRQLRAYFAGDLEKFEITLAPQGTAFQQSVWKELCLIPYGETISYGELARRIGNPKASRAVGLANGSNPISVIVPCHRVIGSNG